MHKDTLFQEAANLYFDILSESGKPPRVSVLCSRLAEKFEYEQDIIKSLLRDPEFDAMLISRRKRRIIEEAALKIAAAEYAEKIQHASLARIVDMLESESDISMKELIAAAELANKLNLQVDKDIEQVTGSGNMTVNIEFKELLLKVDPERRESLIAEAMRRIGAPKGEVIDVACSDCE